MDNYFFKKPNVIGNRQEMPITIVLIIYFYRFHFPVL